MRRWCSLVLGTPYFFGGRRLRQGVPLALSIACSSWGCTLITDVDRERIPVPVQPPFEEVDGGAEPPVNGDAAAPDAATPDASALDDAGVPDASSTASDAGDAAAPSGDAG
jgi:hypothetical protein